MSDTADRQAELDAALDKGEIAELPPNIPPGILGEKGMNLYKVDSDGPHGLNAGVTQESTSQTLLLGVLLAYVLFFPLAYFLLWRTDKMSLKQKIALSVLMVAGIAYVAWRFAAR